MMDKFDNEVLKIYPIIIDVPRLKYVVKNFIPWFETVPVDVVIDHEEFGIFYDIVSYSNTPANTLFLKNVPDIYCHGCKKLMSVKKKTTRFFYDAITVSQPNFFKECFKGKKGYNINWPLEEFVYTPGFMAAGLWCKIPVRVFAEISSYVCLDKNCSEHNKIYRMMPSHLYGKGEYTEWFFSLLNSMLCLDNSYIKYKENDLESPFDLLKDYRSMFNDARKKVIDRLIQDHDNKLDKNDIQLMYDIDAIVRHEYYYLASEDIYQRYCEETGVPVKDDVYSSIRGLLNDLKIYFDMDISYRSFLKWLKENHPKYFE